MDARLNGEIVAYADAFKPHWKKNRDSIFAACDVLVEVEIKLKKIRCADWENFKDLLPVSDGEIKKLMPIGKDRRLRRPQIYSLLPCHYSIIYQVTQLTAKTDKKFSAGKPRREPPLTVSKSELDKLRKNGLLPERYLSDIEFVAKDPKTKRERSFSFAEAGPNQLFLIRGYYKDDGIFPKGFRTFKALVLGATNFPPSVAKYLYQRYTDDIKDQDEIIVYDPSAGFGGRLLGALAAGTDRQLHYVGTDPNPDNWLEAAGISRYEALARFHRRNVCQARQTTHEFFKLGSEVIRHEKRFNKYRGKLDLVFTSPPYYGAEGYSDDEHQSNVKFTTYDEWRDGFLRPTLETAVEWLKPGRPLIWNIADTTDNGHYWPLEDDSKAILEDLGMRYETKLKYVLSHSPGANRFDRKGIPETKNFCMIGGRYRKYEPIFVFRKPG